VRAGPRWLLGVRDPHDHRVDFVFAASDLDERAGSVNLIARHVDRGHD
jgi:hypothetical protein